MIDYKTTRYIMYKKTVFVIAGILFSIVSSFSQEMERDSVAPVKLPVISYSSTPRTYTIADIKVSGTENYDDFIIIGLSGLAVGDEITIPGDEIPGAIKRFWKHGLFSDIKISATKIEGIKIWLQIDLKQRPRISQINYHGVKKGEREDLEARLGLIVGNQITPNLIDRAKIFIKRYFDEKGFRDAEVTIMEKPDNAAENRNIVDIHIDKKEKIKVNKIYITGNEVLSDGKLKRTMKKTNENGDWKNLFKSKKFVVEEFEKDKDLIIEKYGEYGYRDAVITSDSIVKYDEKKVDVYLTIEEGNKYYIRNIQWIGNKLYSAEWLGQEVLSMKPGDVYNRKKLNERLEKDDDAVANIYMNNGYLFFQIEPVEVNIEQDSVDLEIRIFEGAQANINKIEIRGNDRLYEHVVRRELRTKPGALFSKDDVMRSLREIMQMGHFNPENLNPDIVPNRDNGTVDITYKLESKASDQIEFSLGWGYTGLVGRLGLKFSNFSMKNLFGMNNRRGIIPQGEGQTLSLSGQTNGSYYQSYSISFMEPWFGGKRPNTLSVGAYYSKTTNISSTYANSYYNNMFYSDPYNQNMYAYADPNTSFQVLGISLGLGKRLNWPDDFFTIYGELSYQQYKLKNWSYFIIQNGNCNNASLRIVLSRNSTDNPIFTRRGSAFSLSVSATPPFSLWDGKDYANIADHAEEKQKWIEYHKWKFNSRVFTPLTPDDKLILMARADFGLVGYYNKHKKSPFETFTVGGSGMTGYSSTYAMETVALRGYNDGSVGTQSAAYSRFVMELRYPFMLQPTSTIYGLVFLEGGNAWRDINKFNPLDIKRTAGAGIRIMLPMIGLMGLDWGYGFDKINGTRNNSGQQFHFILGQEF